MSRISTENYFHIDPRKSFIEDTQISHIVLLLVNIAALVYFSFILFFVPVGNPLLYGLLIFGEIFHLWQVMTFSLTVLNTEHKHIFSKNLQPKVDVFITVAGEPVDIVRETAIAAKNINYPDFEVYLLNDGYVAKKDNWKDIEALADELGIHCITRTVPGGAKAGNINNALKTTSSPLVVIFDADHVPYQRFLETTVGYFIDEKIAFVQTPQYYKNQNQNRVTKGAWRQQELFFGPICKGKNRSNSAFMCGTNMVLKREALESVGGMCEFNIAEDFLTSLFVHSKKWKSVYVPEVLAEGLAPEDFLSYYKQQFRWARGSLEIIFKYNPLFRSGMTWSQKLEYLSSASYYLSGVIVFVNMIFPIIFMFTGAVPVESSTMAIALFFIPYIYGVMYILQRSNNFSYTFEALSFSVSSFYLQITAIIAVLTNKKTSFAVTSKTQVSGNFLYLATPHLIYILVGVIGIIYYYLNVGFNPSLVTNALWFSLNVVMFIPFIYATMSGMKFPRLFSNKVNSLQV